MSKEGKQKPKRGPKEPTRGREAGGLACIGCVEFTQQRNAAGGFTGSGWCAAREKTVASSNRKPCGLYLFRGRQ